MVDTDFSASNLGVHLGRYDHPVKMQDVLYDEADTESAVFRHPTGIKAIAASTEIHHVEPDIFRLREVMEEAAEDSDYFLVDCPPELDSIVESVMDACNELVILKMPTQTAGINAAQIIEKANQEQQPILGTAINKMEYNPEKELVEREVEMMTESDSIEIIPYDHKMKESLFHKTSLANHEPISEATLEIQEMAAQLEGKQFERPRFAGVKSKLKKFKECIQR